jgi:hypothetical protein
MFAAKATLPVLGCPRPLDFGRLDNNYHYCIQSFAGCWKPCGGFSGIWLDFAEAEMSKRLYVGNLPYSATDDSLRQAFAAHGTVASVQVIMDRDTGRSKGFAFVEMSNDQEAQAAIDALNGKELDGRALTVNEARPKTEGGGGRGGGRRY